MKTKKELLKLKKTELIQELLAKPNETVNNSLNNCNIRVDVEAMDPRAVEGMNNVAKALLNLTEVYNQYSLRPVYGVYVSTDGIKEGGEE